MRPPRRDRHSGQHSRGARGDLRPRHRAGGGAAAGRTRRRWVRFHGYVADQTLAVLYRLASVFVFPSLYEGFGLPPLEAMASGTPVITSNVSSLPEVVGDAALLVDPYSAQAIADGILQVLRSMHLREELRRRGFARVRDFSWERSARQVRSVYEEVVMSRTESHAQ
ncbi:MAG: glycosyltransferase family 4 protein [Acidobacteria bacterium]|nr:glycosyltransferase family 4 protein [Acidobacteriota bacterium]